MAVESKIVSDAKKSTIVVTITGKPVQEATDKSPNWDSILKLVASPNPNEEKLFELFDVARTAAKKLEPLSERIRIANGTVYFDGAPVDTTLSRQVARFVGEGHDCGPLVKFWEKIETNPDPIAKQETFDWLASLLEQDQFCIDEDGDIRGYKGTEKRTEGGVTTYLSTSSGAAIVNDEKVTGKIPNPIGGTVEMPRADCDHSRQACSKGLHIATHSFARTYGNVVLEVKVNPRDIVAVPKYEKQKIRACRYTVIGESNDGPRKGALVKIEPSKPVATKTREERAKDQHVKATKVVRKGTVDKGLAAQYEGKKRLVNRKTGRVWFITSKKSGVLRMLAADGSGERTNKPEANIRKSFAIQE